jgi:DNA (cytosine-5)-methyltransferase 1
MYSPTKVRMLTERECARIQKFPDNFQFVGPKREVYRQIGNSVPTLLAKAIGEKIKENL